ncbi:conserved hypothetical protein [Rhodospirillum rubrum ATCC 11170]|uniref:Leucine-binding protein domain-containing protein n=2 Tax=Rhodospirillum rubrum TaxID=1085 RepID=Q2RN07_RHORT|nr:conserved hypothetical protein [Rhodospirillum rubrum ATCC 11170]MBK5956214.1 penicillin-binding protein activator [Rhodospirillum rubrum]HAP98973.1 penicillin-binding protein activator [Rhodospirillum rubrum]HCF19426.1 penicillin-binding protein activator [Rhodospirillum rubrum]
MTRNRGWRSVRMAIIAALGLGLAACAANREPAPPSPSSYEPPPMAQPSPPVQSAPMGGPGLLDQGRGQAARVAFLAPLTGQAAQTGQALLNAAQIAAIEVGPQDFVLQPYDTAGSAGGAAQAARTALSQGAGMIIGPLFADSVRAIGPLAQQAGVPVVAFSTDQTVAGGSVHLIGFLVEEQVRRVLRHARGQGRTTLAALLPATPLGQATAEAARRVAAEAGLRVAAIEYYDPTGKGVAQPAGRVLAAGGFDTLLLSDKGLGLQAVAAQLAYSGLNPGQAMVLGTMLWNDEPGLGREPLLVGARFAAPDESGAAAFKAQYQATYGAVPPSIAGLGYDATALAAVLARGGAGALTVDGVRNPNGFAGVDGIFRFRPDGTVERGLAIREVTRDGTVQVEPAPTNFATVGY